MQSSTGPAVELSAVSKRFGSVTAVDEVSLTVPAGSCYGLAGPNGAGKSTTLAMIAGLLEPDAGSITINGVNPVNDREAALDQLGMVMEGLSLPERLTGPELLTYFGRLRGLGKKATPRARDLLKVLGLSDASSTLIIDYSTGMRKKIGLALALLPVPQVLVLDEPFDAIDPVSVQAIEGVLRQYVSGGRTVLLSSHVMDVVERNCQQVAVIDNGRIVAAGDIASIAADGSLHQAFIDLVGSPQQRELSWLQ